MSQILSTVEPCVFDGLRQLQGGLISNNKINYISYKEKNTTTASGNDPIKKETYSKTGNWSSKYKYCLLGEWVICVPVRLVPIAIAGFDEQCRKLLRHKLHGYIA